MAATSPAANDIPKGNANGFVRYLSNDLTSGALVFLIALPLCLGISLASGFPPIAGIFTAIVGAIVCTFISNSELTIKGPAAGLIVIAIGCIEDFGGDGMIGGWEQADMNAYRAALTVGVLAAILQIIFGIFRAGIVGEFFPSATVHGMLAAIGVIIIAKQIPVTLGVVGASGEPLEMLREIPHYIAEANPAIAAIGLVSLLIMFVWPHVSRRSAFLKRIPSPLVVLLVAIPMGMAFDLLHSHPYKLANHEYQLGEQYLVKMPEKVFGLFDDITLPDVGVINQWKTWKWAMMFFIIGTLESLLSAKAIDLLDPWKRKTNMDRDIVAVGTANLLAASIGGLPMISEIVRSKANIDNGARTRFADMWHGLLLLTCVALIPSVLHRIPLAALAAMLVYTGFRLAHPNEFLNVWRIGKEQLVIFVSTLVGVLAIDLLIGVLIGILVKFTIHTSNGVPFRNMFKPFLEIQPLSDNTSLIVAKESAVFSNWLPFRRQIEQVGLVQKRNLIVDLSGANLVDHSVMEKLEEMHRDFEREGLTFEVRGLDSLKPLADSPFSARKRSLITMQRVTIVTLMELEAELVSLLRECGATGYTAIPCYGSGQTGFKHELPSRTNLTRIEVVAPLLVCSRILDGLRSDYVDQHPMTVCVETVDVLRASDFTTLSSEAEKLAGSPG